MPYFLPSVAPRCVEPFRLQRVPSQSAGIPSGGSFNCYRLICPCGQELWRVHGYWFADFHELADPLAVQCCNCHAVRELIDRERDGYDGEIGAHGMERLTGPRDVWNCPYCHSAEGRLIASFGYHYEEFGPTKAEVERSQDFFDAFILVHICQNTDKVVEVAVFECA